MEIEQRSKTRIIHGTMMYIAHTGVLIIGDSCSGKSEIALHLMAREHSLISDDAVQLQRHDNTLVASAPNEFFQQCHLRNIGLIQPTKHFNHNTTISSVPIALVVKLARQTTAAINSLQLPLDTIEYLDIHLPLSYLLPSIYCPPAIRLETLVKQFKLVTESGQFTLPAS